MNKKCLCLCLLIVELGAIKTTFKNDTKTTYFVVCGDKGSLLEPGKDCTCDISQVSWLKSWWSENYITLYKQITDGKFIDALRIKPRLTDEEATTILISDIHRQVRNEKAPFYVKKSKRIVSKVAKN